MELVTDAFEYVAPFGLHWLVLSVSAGLLLISIGYLVSTLTTREPFYIYFAGGLVLIVGSLFVVAGSTAGGTRYNQDLLNSDLNKQFQIEEVVQNGEWYTGKDADGYFIKFALIKKDNSENTYKILMEK